MKTFLILATLGIHIRVSGKNTVGEYVVTLTQGTKVTVIFRDRDQLIATRVAESVFFAARVIQSYRE